MANTSCVHQSSCATNLVAGGACFLHLPSVRGLVLTFSPNRFQWGLGVGFEIRAKRVSPLKRTVGVLSNR